MKAARRCKAEGTRAPVAAIMVHAAKLERVSSLVLVARLADREAWEEIAEEHGITTGEAKRVFRRAVADIEALLELQGKLKRRRKQARNLKLRA